MAIADHTAAPQPSSTSVVYPHSLSMYHSKLRAKRDERMQQQQHQQLFHQHHDGEPTTADPHDTASDSTTLSLSTLPPPAAGNLPTTRLSARSSAADEVRRRQRAEARRQLIEFAGSMWDVVRVNDMVMLRNYFLVEGAAKMVHAHSKSADEFGRTLLHTAAWWGRGEAAQYLIANGATLNAIDTATTRRTPLMDAARAGHTDIGLLLLAHEADVTLQDSSGDNAFHWAARYSRGMFLLRLSLELQARSPALLSELWTAINVRGRTPVDYIRAHPTLFPMISKRLGAHVPLQRVALSSAHRHQHLLDVPISGHARVDAEGPRVGSESLRPTTAPTDATPRSGVDALGLDVGSFAYKSRESIPSR